MSIWLGIGLLAYCLGAVIQWLKLREDYQDWEDYNNFPVVCVTQFAVLSICFIVAWVWPCILIADNEFIWSFFEKN